MEATPRINTYANVRRRERGRSTAWRGLSGRWAIRCPRPEGLWQPISKLRAEYRAWPRKWRAKCERLSRSSPDGTTLVDRGIHEKQRFGTCTKINSEQHMACAA